MSLNISQSTWFYQAYEPYLKKFDKNDWKSSTYDEWSETRFFKPEQIQECLAPEYPDLNWAINDRRKGEILKDLMKAAGSLDVDNYNFGLVI